MGIRRAVAVVAASALLAGCAAEGAPSGDRVDLERMRRTAEDTDADAAAIVRAGRAVDAATAGGTVLVTYTVDDEDASQGRSAGAWRLYDDRRPLADGRAGVTLEGAASPQVTAVEDGYLVLAAEGRRAWHVAVDGTRRAVPVEPARPTRAGDLLVDLGPTRDHLYRPATHTLATSTPSFGPTAQDWTVSADGTLWRHRGVQGGRLRFERAAPGGSWVPVASYAPRPGTGASNTTLTAVGDHVVLPVTDGTTDRGSEVVGLLVRRSGAPARSPWRLLPADVPGTAWWDVRVQVVDENTVAIGTYGDDPFLVDARSGTWAPLRPPTHEKGWTYAFDDGRAYATQRDHADARVSRDRGRTWTRLPH